jgi:hypothetical protein
VCSSDLEGAISAVVDNDGMGWWYGLICSDSSWSIGLAKIDPADILHNLPAADSLEKRPG